MFRAIDPDCWERARANPRRLLNGIGRRQMQPADRDADLTARIERLASELRNDRHRPWRERPISPQHPVAFCCVQFGVHGSLPIYSGGLGILAGDILKEASDLALPRVSVGLKYRTGYFHPRMDGSGRAASLEDHDIALAGRWVGAATCGSTCRGRRSRPVAPAG